MSYDVEGGAVCVTDAHKTAVDVMKQVLKEKAMGRPIKKRRVDMMAVLKDQEARLHRMEVFLNDLAQDLADAAHKSAQRQDSQIVIARPRPPKLA